MSTVVSAQAGERLETRALGELVLIPEDYPRRGLSLTWTAKLTQMLVNGIRWATPLAVDQAGHLLDGRHRFEAYRQQDPAGWPLIEVEVRVVDCRPEDRRYMAALLNRAHGRQLDDDEVAPVAAERAQRLAGDDLKALRQQARRLARELAVDATQVLAILFPKGAPARPRPLPVLTPQPIVVYDPGEYTVQAILEHAAWLAEALAAKGNEVARDPRGPGALRRLWGILDYLLREDA